MRRLAMLMATVALIAAACGDSDPATTAAATPPEAEVAVGSSALGDHLIDADGNTLYVFLPDAQGESTCYDQCAATWPPFSGEGAGAGVDAAQLGRITRTGGAPQTTYNGWPLYYFANDAAAGDANGQGIGDVWYVVSPGGDPIQ